jgi:hypothetical protein
MAHKIRYYGVHTCFVYENHGKLSCNELEYSTHLFDAAIAFLVMSSTSDQISEPSTASTVLAPLQSGNVKTLILSSPMFKCIASHS